MYITRTFTITIAEVAEVTKNKEGIQTVTVIERLKIEGEVDETKALKIAKKKYKEKSNLVITDIKTTTELRGMDLEQFMKNSVLMENPRTPKTETAVK